MASSMDAMSSPSAAALPQKLLCHFKYCEKDPCLKACFLTCREAGCPYKDKQMHEDCFDEAHVMATEHKRTATRSDQESLLHVGSSRSSTSEYIQKVGASAGGAAGAVGNIAVARLGRDFLVKELGQESAKEFGKDGAIAAGYSLAKGGWQRAAGGAAVTAGAVFALESIYNYNELVSFRITPREFKIKTAGAALGGAAGAAGSTGGLLAGAQAGALLMESASFVGPWAVVVGAIGGSVVGGLVAGGMIRWGAESALVKMCGEDKCRTALMVADSIKRLNLHAHEPQLISMETLNSNYRRMGPTTHPDKLKREEGETDEQFNIKKDRSNRYFLTLGHDYLMVKHYIENRSSDDWKNGPNEFLSEALKEYSDQFRA